jgi:hypothetical protein
VERFVLILTYADDAHAERLGKELTKFGVRVLAVPRGKISDWRVDEDGSNLLISGPGEPTRDARAFAAAFFRCLPRSADFGSDDGKADLNPDAYIGLQRESLFYDWLHTLSLYIPFYSDVAATSRSSGKIFQRAIAKRVGLETPDEYAGDHPDRARSFVERIWASNREVCTKALAAKNLLLRGERYTRYTEKFSTTHIDQIKELSGCPLIFQDYIEKSYEIRVTVVGDRLLACRIESQVAGGETATDWRRYNLPRTPHTRYELPTDIAAKLLEFHRATGLQFSAFDLARAKDGRYLFLETNAFGQWLWIEDLTGMPITRTIAATLAGAG